MNKDTAAKYVVNLEEIQVFLNKLKPTLFKEDEDDEYRLYSNSYKTSIGMNNFIFFLQQIVGEITDITFIFPPTTNAKKRLTLKLDDNIIIENKPIVQGKIKYKLPTTIPFYFSTIFIDVDSEKVEEFYVNIGIRNKKDIYKEFLKNCFITYINIEDDSVIKEFSFSLPKSNEFYFNPEATFEDYELVYSDTPLIQELDEYEFNVTVPESNNNIYYKFYYRRRVEN